MSKLGLLKDSDFKQMHDSKLPVAVDNADLINEFAQTIEKDVRFLESLRIMDYSLFLIVLQVPERMVDQTFNRTTDNLMHLTSNNFEKNKLTLN